ncbi:hypothetical protein [Dyella mobilis]|uniref:Uncharacterized protein n=1 Tax=Dyella mobilis TaxID=1849582 RepID=A0ABS2KE97_9GAMM|nr:hypothetical protein [Dyella mobilis]MBM7129380.1 hypothetical protein [Dyella mobilis]GLQ98675.1 hypothetical protein GCM10007863_30950 [Dyella mobilis]
MKALPETVTFPWLGVSVPVQVDSDFATGEERIALDNIGLWTPSLKISLERACFADYLTKVYEIGAEPPTVPVIKRPQDIWRHITINSVRLEGKAHVIVYAVPSWHEDLHHEWCIEGTDTLHYVVQFLACSAEGYDIIDSTNSARGYDAVIERFSHIPQSWPSQ